MSKKEKNTIIIRPQKGSQEIAFNSKADVIIYGGSAGSGKSHLLLMHPLQHVVNDKNFHGVYFRRVTTQLIGAGGLWPESQKLYSPFKIKSRTKPQLQRVFPKGGSLTFMHMQHEDDRFNHQGLQYSAIYFDEL